MRSYNAAFLARLQRMPVNAVVAAIHDYCTVRHTTSAKFRGVTLGRDGARWSWCASSVHTAQQLLH